MDPEFLLLLAVTTDDLKLLRIGLLLRMNDYAACLKSAMRVACTSGNLDIVQELLSAGAQPTESLLWAACREGHISIVSALFEQSSIAVTKQGLAVASDIAQRHGHHNIMMYLSNLPEDLPGLLQGFSSALTNPARIREQTEQLREEEDANADLSNKL
jgi:hypothetical protein